MRPFCLIAVLLVARIAKAADDGAPPVLLSTQHAKLCAVKQGDSFPAIELPQADGKQGTVKSLAGAKGTVVLFWRPDHWMSRAAIADLGVLARTKKIPADVHIVGIVVGSGGQAELAKDKSQFPQFVDADGKAFARVGSARLPRIFVLDPAGKIVWFDIEYSEATRRELQASVATLQ